MIDVCEHISGRADKNFLGTGNLGLVIDETGVRLLFVQQWQPGGWFDWASGKIRSWAPDRIELDEPTPPLGAEISPEPAARWVCAARDDILGMALEWQNESEQELVVQAAFRGVLPGPARLGKGADAGLVYSSAAYSDLIPKPVHYVLGASEPVERVDFTGKEYEITFAISIAPHTSRRLTLFWGIGFDRRAIENALKNWQAAADVLAAVRQDWNTWFDSAIPRFRCSNPFFEKLYYYRWWSLYTKMIFAQVGHLLYPAPREGVIAYEGLVSYSGACVSIDELRWMRDPAWAFSTAREFFAPQNLNDGVLSNHIWDWGIDGDESNQDSMGRSVPYQNYAVAAFHGAVLVHPDEGLKTLREIWPQLASNLASYPRLFDRDQDGLYETYPWSNSSGQEWTARFLYFNPIPEIFRYERGRTYAPDGSRADADLELAHKIRRAVVTAPDLFWPDNAPDLYRLYAGRRDHRLATVDQSTYAYKNFQAAARLAGLMGDAAALEHYAQMAEHTRTQICTIMWDAQDAFFYDVRPVDHRPARVKAVTGFYVFWAQIAEDRHLPMLRHLFNRATFWTAYPLPSLPLDYEKYHQIQEAGWTYWNYYTWPRTTCHVVDGLFWAAKTLDPALADKAALLFDRYTHMHFPHDDLQRPNIAERYDPHTAEPVMEHLDYNHSAWIDLLIRHVAGLTPQESEEIFIDPLDMGWESFSLTNIRYREHDVDVEYSRGEGFIVRIDGVVRAKTAELQKVIFCL